MFEVEVFKTHMVTRIDTKTNFTWHQLNEIINSI